MDNHEFISWIRNEIASTTVVLRDEIIGYEETLEPNPELNCSEFTSYPVAGQHIIVARPVYGRVARIVLDEARASRAARVLVALVLSDARYLYLAKELMGTGEFFRKFWEDLAVHGTDRKTVRSALHYIGRTPGQLFMKGTRRAGAWLKGPLEFAGKVITAVCVYGTIIYVLWPKSRLGQCIGSIIKKVLIEAKQTVYG